MKKTEIELASNISEDLASGRPAKKSLVKPMGDKANDNSANFKVKDLPSLKIKEEKGRGPTGLSYTVSQGHPDAENPKTGKKHPERQSPEYKAKFMKDKPGLKQYTEAKAGDTCSCCDSKIDDKGSCGCDSSCKHCGGSHNITELKTQTLSNYIRKSVSPLSKKSVGNLASKGAHKLAHSDDFDAGEKEDMKSVQRAKGVIRATKTLAKRATQNEAKKPIVHSTKSDSLKTVKIKYNGPPIKTKITNIGPGGKETVQKDWSEGYKQDFKRQEAEHEYAMDKKLAKKKKTHTMPDGSEMKGAKHPNLQNQIKSQFKEQKRIMSNLKTESARDNYDPEISDMRTKEKLKKAGLPKESPKINETKYVGFDLNDMEESLANLLTRGIEKVRAAVDKADEKEPVSPSKKKLYNPVSGDNIKKRLEKKR